MSPLECAMQKRPACHCVQKTASSGRSMSRANKLGRPRSWQRDKPWLTPRGSGPVARCRVERGGAARGRGQRRSKPAPRDRNPSCKADGRIQKPATLIAARHAGYGPARRHEVGRDVKRSSEDGDRVRRRVAVQASCAGGLPTVSGIAGAATDGPQLPDAAVLAELAHRQRAATGGQREGSAGAVVGVGVGCLEVVGNGGSIGLRQRPSTAECRCAGVCVVAVRPSNRPGPIGVEHR